RHAEPAARVVRPDGLPRVAGLRLRDLLLSRDGARLELALLLRWRPREVQQRGADRGLREGEAPEEALPGGESDPEPRGDEALRARRGAALRLPGGIPVLLPGLEPRPVALPQLGRADVLDLRLRRLAARAGRLHPLHA